MLFQRTTITYLAEESFSSLCFCFWGAKRCASLDNKGLKCWHKVMSARVCCSEQRALQSVVMADVESSVQFP